MGIVVGDLTWAADSPNEVPFKLYRGYVIVVRGSIGGLKNLNFLVDTGAVPSVVDARIARKLHLRGQAGASRCANEDSGDRTGDRARRGTGSVACRRTFQ